MGPTSYSTWSQLLPCSRIKVANEGFYQSPCQPWQEPSFQSITQHVAARASRRSDQHRDQKEDGPRGAPTKNTESSRRWQTLEREQPPQAVAGRSKAFVPSPLRERRLDPIRGRRTAIIAAVQLPHACLYSCAIYDLTTTRDCVEWPE